MLLVSRFAVLNLPSIHALIIQNNRQWPYRLESRNLRMGNFQKKKPQQYVLIFVMLNYRWIAIWHGILTETQPAGGADRLTALPRTRFCWINWGFYMQRSIQFKNSFYIYSHRPKTSKNRTTQTAGALCLWLERHLWITNISNYSRDRFGLSVHVQLLVEGVPPRPRERPVSPDGLDGFRAVARRQLVAGHRWRVAVASHRLLPPGRSVQKQGVGGGRGDLNKRAGHAVIALLCR